MHACMHVWMYVHMNVCCMYVCMHVCMYFACMAGWLVGWLAGWMDGWMELYLCIMYGWMGGCMDGCMYFVYHAWPEAWWEFDLALVYVNEINRSGCKPRRRMSKAARKLIWLSSCQCDLAENMAILNPRSNLRDCESSEVQCFSGFPLPRTRDQCRGCLSVC